MRPKLKIHTRWKFVDPKASTCDKTCTYIPKSYVRVICEQNSSTRIVNTAISKLQAEIMIQEHQVLREKGF